MYDFLSRLEVSSNLMALACYVKELEMIPAAPNTQMLYFILIFSQ